MPVLFVTITQLLEQTNTKCPSLFLTFVFRTDGNFGIHYWPLLHNYAATLRSQGIHPYGRGRGSIPVALCKVSKQILEVLCCSLSVT